MRRLACMSSLPWLCFGDFKILNLNEKSEGLDRNAGAIAEFRDVRECKLVDLGSRGYPFTWSNRQFGPCLIEEKFDRFMCNQEWKIDFRDDLATNLAHWESDHRLIMMEINGRQRSLVYEKKTFTRIHYKDMCSSCEACKNIVNEEWSNWHTKTEASPVHMFRNVAKRSMAQLILWSREEFRDRDKKLKELVKKLKQANEEGDQYEKENEIGKIEKQIQVMLMDEEMYWKQRSRADWLKKGDRNTKFFHAKASSMKRKNKIEGIKDNSGSWLEEEGGIKNKVCDYFQDIFTTSQPNEAQIEAALQGMCPKVNS